MGVNRAFDVIKRSAIVIYLFDTHELSSGDLKNEMNFIKQHINGSQLVVVANKIDVEGEETVKLEYSAFEDIIYISAKEGRNIHVLKSKLLTLFDSKAVNATDTIVTSARHAESLRKALDALNKITEGLNNKVPGDLLALDIRFALDELGSITGQVTNDDLLGNIFSKFCIGK
jgi:tRNA modification GTPase